jgi:hypothetical protein
VIVTVAAASTERALTASQVAAAGFQVRAAACSAVSLGRSFVGPTARGSISPTRILGPSVRSRTGASPEAKATSTRQDVAAEESRNRKVGASMSSGKIDPSAG